jgi:hypothetical protein
MDVSVLCQALKSISSINPVERAAAESALNQVSSAFSQMAAAGQAAAYYDNSTQCTMRVINRVTNIFSNSMLLRSTVMLPGKL